MEIPWAHMQWDQLIGRPRTLRNESRLSVYTGIPTTDTSIPIQKESWKACHVIGLQEPIQLDYRLDGVPSQSQSRGESPCPQQACIRKISISCHYKGQFKREHRQKNKGLDRKTSPSLSPSMPNDLFNSFPKPFPAKQEFSIPTFFCGILPPYIILSPSVEYPFRVQKEKMYQILDLVYNKGTGI